jgi:hypothetical protein
MKHGGQQFSDFSFLLRTVFVFVLFCLLLLLLLPELLNVRETKGKVLPRTGNENPEAE